jgi:PhnB protein
MRHGDVPGPEAAQLGDTEKNLVMHVGLPILGGHLLMGTDIFPGMGMEIHQGNNIYICLQPDTRGDTDRLFAALGEGGQIAQPLQEMFWGDYFGTLVDRFGIQWMFVCESKE